jgi:hypothetical protein
MKDKLVLLDESVGQYMWYCAGCQMVHAFWTNHKNGEGPNWSFNGDLIKPTFTPSHRVSDDRGVICHSFVTDGKVQYLNDSIHELAGQTVEMVNWEDYRKGN